MKTLLSTLSCSLALLLSPAYAQELSILFAGDIVFDGAPGKLIAAGGDPFNKVARTFANADLRIANFECVMARGGEAFDKNFNFRANPDSFPVLKKHLDAVSIANNHTGDFGEVALNEMLTQFEKENFAFFGGGRNLTQAHQARLIRKNGLTIALLGYNEYMPRSFEAGPDKSGVAWSEDEQVILDIQTAKRMAGVDLVIPYMHWGWENDRLSSQRQRSLARKMIDAGAAAVIGTHPHVTQEAELYRGKPILYSLGNFIIDELDNEPQTQAWLLKLDVNKSGVRSWQTQLVKINQQGIPELVADAETPCQTKQQNQIGLCKSPLFSANN